MLTELGVAECQELVVTTSDSDAVGHGLFDTTEDFVVHPVDRRIDATESNFVREPNANEAIDKLNVASSDAIGCVNRGSVVVDGGRGNSCCTHETTVGRDT